MAWPAGGLAELRWYALVALFVAALATLAVYLVQYALLALRRRRGKRRPPRQPPAAPRDELLEEGGSALAWALSLGSWRRQWRRAWVAALRGEAAARAVSAGLQVRREGGWGRGGRGSGPWAVCRCPSGRPCGGSAARASLGLIEPVAPKGRLGQEKEPGSVCVRGERRSAARNQRWLQAGGPCPSVSAGSAHAPPQPLLGVSSQRGTALLSRQPEVPARSPNGSARRARHRLRCAVTGGSGSVTSPPELLYAPSGCQRCPWSLTATAREGLVPHLVEMCVGDLEGLASPNTAVWLVCSVPAQP